MAIYKYDKYISKGTDAAFDDEHAPHDPAPYSGIYRCMGCGREVTSEEGNSLPPQNHHTHTTAQGKIRWKLVVYANHRAQ